MEVLLAFALGVFASPVFLGFVLILAFWAESVDNHGSSAFLSILGIASAYLLFQFSPVWLLAYLPLGILWSAWRWNLYTRDCVSLAKEGKLTSTGWSEVGDKTKETSRKDLAQAVDLKTHLNLITYWILCFPVSFIERISVDLRLILKVAITDYFAKIYNYSSSKALDDFDKD